MPPKLKRIPLIIRYRPPPYSTESFNWKHKPRYTISDLHNNGRVFGSPYFYDLSKFSIEKESYWKDTNFPIEKQRCGCYWIDF